MRVAAAALLATVVTAWPFSQKRFKEAGFVEAGALGLDDVEGQVVAWGYLNDDRFLDAFVMDDARASITVYTWMHRAFAFNATPAARLTLPADLRVANVVSADFTYDGRADVLVVAEPARGAGPLSLVLWPALPDGSLDTPVVLPAAAHAQPFVVDASGSLRGELLGHAATAPDALSVWRADPASAHFAMAPAPVTWNGGEPCRLAAPHSSAHIDLNGDCVADLFLVCERGAYQIWTARRDVPLTYDLAQSGTLPPGAGALSFADMNRDGTIDVVFPTCERGRCYINIAYNAQVPLCVAEASGTWSRWLGNASAPEAAAPMRCRDALALCEADPDFRLDFAPGSPLLARVPLDEVVAGETQLLLADDIGTRVLPVPLRVGDYNMDGYPDVAVITVPRGARPGDARLHLLASAPCRRGGAPGCDARVGVPRRTFRAVRGTVLDRLEYVRSASFVDVDEDGTLDLLVQTLRPASLRTSNARAHTFIQNNYYDDAFFLKAVTLNAACGARCEPRGAAPYAPWGGALGGASYKFSVLDPNGVRRAQQVGQQAQTAYGALQPPSTYFGLGRTNNYVESLFVGSTRRQPEPVLVLEGVIPNSEVVVIPTQPDAGGSPEHWRRELFLHPADWVPAVTLALGALIAVLGLIVFGLDLREKREDERERQRAVHAINFDAL